MGEAGSASLFFSAPSRPSIPPNRRIVGGMTTYAAMGPPVTFLLGCFLFAGTALFFAGQGKSSYP